MSKYREQKLVMVMTIENGDGESVEISRSNVMEADKILTLGKGGSRCYLDLPDLSIYNPNSKISIDLYQLEPKVIEL